VLSACFACCFCLSVASDHEQQSQHKSKRTVPGPNSSFPLLSFLPAAHLALGFHVFVPPSGISQFCWLLPLSVSSNTSATLRPRVLFKRPLRPPGSREPDPLPPACFFRIPLDLAKKNPTWKLPGVPCGHSHTFWKVSPDAAAQNLVQLCCFRLHLLGCVRCARSFLDVICSSAAGPGEERQSEQRRKVRVCQRKEKEKSEEANPGGLSVPV
jgi:hypothetical protein